jgi:hypothetical protein
MASKGGHATSSGNIPSRINTSNISKSENFVLLQMQQILLKVRVLTKPVGKSSKIAKLYTPRESQTPLIYPSLLKENVSVRKGNVHV